jgi:hypothetical protein
MKKQAFVIMEQSRKSSEKEKISLQQAQEALASKEAAVTEAARATLREDYMLQLMTDASFDMAGVFREFELVYIIPLTFPFSLRLLLNRFFSGCCR